MKKFILVMVLCFVSSAAQADSKCTEAIAKENVEAFLDLVIKGAPEQFKVLESKIVVNLTRSTDEEFVVLFSRRAIMTTNGIAYGDILTSLGIASVSRADCFVNSTEF